MPTSHAHTAGRTAWRKGATPAENYRTVCWIALGGMLCGLAMPLLMRVFRLLLPDALVQCSFRTLWDKPCPMCGLTRGMSAVLRGHWREATRLNLLAVPAFLLAATEVLYRLWVLVRRPPPPLLTRLARLDGRLHLLLLAGYLGYAAGFLLNVFVLAG